MMKAQLFQMPTQCDDDDDEMLKSDISPMAVLRNKQ